MAISSDPPVRGSAATREPGKPEVFTITVLDNEIEVPTEDKNLQIVVTTGEEKFTIPLDKTKWTMRIERIK